jgi:transposase
VPYPQRPRLVAQKKTLRAAEREREAIQAERAVWRDEVRRIDPADLVFIDETGLDTRLTRTHARAPRGERAHGTVPCGRWRRLTLLGALGLDGLVAVMSVAAATSTAVFLAFLEQVLVPALRREPGAVVALDNLAPHRAAAVRDVLEAAGLGLRYLPRYSPDLSPIEPCWSKVKALLRARAARSLDALEQALPAALDAVTAQDAHGWSAHCGYASN